MTVAQRCPRRWRIEQTEPKGRWHPKVLLDAILRQAIMSLSQGEPKEAVASEARSHYRSIAANPGLDVPKPYPVALDACSMLSTILEAISRLVLPVVHQGPLVQVGDVGWQVGSLVDDSGVMHRWATCERADEDTISRELHSWHVYGDMAALQVPAMLHLVEIGQMRDGRRHSPWCRAYRSPAIPKLFKFTRSNSKGTRISLGGNWVPFWYSDSTDQSPARWVDLMEKEKLSLIHHLDVKQLPASSVNAFSHTLKAESERLLALPAQWDQIPMSRPSCDLSLCPWQHICYS